jgi:hypothetical protein
MQALSTARPKLKRVVLSMDKPQRAGKPKVFSGKLKKIIAIIFLKIFLN